MNASEVRILPIVGEAVPGPDMLRRIRDKLGIRVGPYAQEIIEGEAFLPVAERVFAPSVLPISVFGGGRVLTNLVRQEGVRRGLGHIGIEASCFVIEDVVTRGAMPFDWLVFMREPGLDVDPACVDIRRLLVLSFAQGLWSLHGYHDIPDFQWYQQGGFVFEALRSA